MQIEPHQLLAAQLLRTELQRSKTWLERVIHRTHENDAAYLLQLCKATLSCLRQTLPYSAGAALAADLPLLMRGMWFEEWMPGESTLTCLTITEFVRCVRPLLHGHYAEAVMEEDVLAVLRAFFETCPAAGDVARPYLPEELIKETPADS